MRRLPGCRLLSSSLRNTPTEAARVAVDDEMGTVYSVNQYAVGPGQPGGTRHFDM